MKTVYFVRHGESTGNVGFFFQSPEDPLTENGLLQAKDVAQRCASLKFDTLISSTMMRARQTAQAISERVGCPVESSDLFTERYRPEILRGHGRDDPKYVPIGKAWVASILEDGPRVEDGENFDDLKARAGQALDLLQHHRSENILVVTHGFFLRTLIARVIYGDALTGRDLKLVIDSFRTNNTGISMIQYGTHARENDSNREGEYWILRIWNDHAHLG